MTEITHRMMDGRMVQIVSPARLRAVLDADGDDYTRPSDFRPDDEWRVAVMINRTLQTDAERRMPPGPRAAVQILRERGHDVAVRINRNGSHRYTVDGRETNALRMITRFRHYGL